MKENKKPTVLFVDDEEELVELMALRLDDGSFEPMTAYGGHQAAELIRNNKIDLVISDVRMPEGSGIELLNIINKEFNGLPKLIFVTGYSDGGDEEQLIKMGAIDFLDKPIDFSKLTHLIKENLH